MKGWTVKTQATKKRAEGIASREVYLHDKNHKNHAKTEVIGRVWGDDKTMATIAHNGAMAAAKLKAKGKGGRPPESYAMEFTLNLPKGYRPSGKQWQAIAKQAIIDVAAKLKISPKVLAKQTYAVVHKQSQKAEFDAQGRSIGTGDHMHLIMGKFTPKGLTLRDLQRKTVTHVVKDSFNSTTLKMGFDWTQYKEHKLQAQVYANKRSVPSWKVKAAREHSALDLKNELLDQRELDISKKNRQLKELQSLTVKFQNQAEKWLEAFDNADSRQMNRQANRMNKVIDELSQLTPSPELEQTAKTMMTFADKINAVQAGAIKPINPEKSPKSPTKRSPRPSTP